MFHDLFQPLVHDVIEQLVRTVEQHYRSLIRPFVGATSYVELRDGANSWWTDSGALCQWVFLGRDHI